MICLTAQGKSFLTLLRSNICYNTVEVVKADLEISEFPSIVIFLLKHWVPVMLWAKDTFSKLLEPL